MERSKKNKRTKTENIFSEVFVRTARISGFIGDYRCFGDFRSGGEGLRFPGRLSFFSEIFVRRARIFSGFSRFFLRISGVTHTAEKGPLRVGRCKRYGVASGHESANLPLFRKIVEGSLVVYESNRITAAGCPVQDHPSVSL